MERNMQRNYLNNVKQNTNTLKKHTNYLNNYTKEKQSKGILNVGTY